MFRNEHPLVANWEMTDGHLARAWYPSDESACSHDAGAMSDFNAELLIWLAPFSTATLPF
jgi:hypothetical protein